MADIATLLVLHELVNSDDEKPHRGKTRKCVKRRSERGYFNNIIIELRIEDLTGFREMFRMNVTDYEFILTPISDLISSQDWLLSRLVCDLLFFLSFCGTPQIIDIRMSVKTFETHSNAYVLHSTQWLKTKCLMKLHSNASNMKTWFDEPENVGRKVWSRTNFIQLHLFSFFMNFLISQIHPTFRPISKNYNVWWNVGCTCVGLYLERIIYGFTWKYLRVEYWLLQTYWLDRQWVHYLCSCYLIKGTMLAVMKLNIRNYYSLICAIMLIQAFL